MALFAEAALLLSEYRDIKNIF